MKLSSKIQKCGLSPMRKFYPCEVAAEARGLRVCPQTGAVWKNAYLERKDPRGEPYWWLVGEIPPQTINAGSDKDLLNRGYITVTPLRFDFTDEQGLTALTGMLDEDGKP